MDASATSRRAGFDLLHAPVESVARAMCGALLSLVALAGAFVWLRRATGHLGAPLSPGALVAAGAAIALAVLAFRSACSPMRLVPARMSWRDWLSTSVPTVIAVLSAAAVSLDGSPRFGLVGLWALVVGAEAASWGVALERRQRSRGTVPIIRSKMGLSPSPTPVSSPSLVTDDAELESFDSPVNPLDDPSASQFMVRRRDLSGRETIEGWARAEFVASQRHATVHLAICPPLDRTPECYAELSDGPAGEIKVAQVLPWGVRLEIKLDKPAEVPAIALVEFSIQERDARGE
jgi:hypothetical protein